MVLYYKSPIGLIEIRESNNKIVGVDFVQDRSLSETKTDMYVPNILDKAYNQIDEYFKGNRKYFDLDIQIEGTNFQSLVWNELCNIKYGSTSTYLQIAKNIGNPKACRAVGNANNKNRIAIIVPCHRVIGSNNKLVGYAGGMERKKWLLDHEANNI